MMCGCTPSQLVEKAEAREKERQRSEERKVRFVLESLHSLLPCDVFTVCCVVGIATQEGSSVQGDVEGS